jgi:hypothetical protein
MEKTIRIPPPNIKDLEVMIKNIKGSPLLMLSQEPEKLKHYTVAGKKKTYGIPSGMFKRSIVELANNRAYDRLYSRRKDIRRGIWIQPDSKSVFGEDLVTLKGGTPKPYQGNHVGGMIVTYIKFDTWEAKLRIRFNTDLFTAEEIVNLVLLSGEPHYRRLHLSSGGFYIAEQPAPTVRDIKVR